MDNKHAALYNVFSSAYLLMTPNWIWVAVTVILQTTPSDLYLRRFTHIPNLP